MTWKRRLRAYYPLLIKLLVGVIISAPLLYALLLSFMLPRQISSYPPTFIPRPASLDNYVRILSRYLIAYYLRNSFVSCAVVIAANVISSCLAAYALVFCDFKGKNAVFVMILSTIMIPADSTIIANYLTITQFKLNDTIVALVLPYLAHGMSIFLMRQFFLTIPLDLRHAATIDGCGDMAFLTKIVVPISIPSIAALSVYNFVITYNQFLWPLLVTNSERMRTVQVAISIVAQAEQQQFGEISAAALIFLLPPILAFVIGHKYLLAGMTAGAIKG